MMGAAGEGNGAGASKRGQTREGSGAGSARSLTAQEPAVRVLAPVC